MVRDRVLIGVPGTGALDIEPMEDAAEGAVALSAFVLLTLAASIFIAAAIGTDASGVEFGSSANSAICDQFLDQLPLREIDAVPSTSSQAYSQCVSDLF